MKKSDYFLITTVLMVISLWIGIKLGKWAVERDAIEQGVGKYIANPQTGYVTFTWDKKLNNK